MIWSRAYFYLSLFFVTIFISCNADLEDEIDHLEEELVKLKSVVSLLEFKTIIYEVRNSEILILELTDDNETITLNFENGINYEVSKDIVFDYNIDNVNWLLHFTLSDSSKLSTFILGDDLIPEKVNNNPFNISPLTSIAEINTPISGKFIIKVIGQDGPKSDFIINSDNFSKSHSLEIFGLYADYNNQIELIFTNNKGVERTRSNFFIQTKKLRSEFPKFNIVKQYNNVTQNTLFLVNYRTRNAPHPPFMVDNYGKIRWYSEGFSTWGKYGLQLFKNGNIGYGKSGPGQASIIEYTIMGELINEFDIYPEFENMHHDVYEMSDGNLLVLADKVGIETIEDHIILMERNSGSIIKTWDLREILQMDRNTLWKIGDGNDWFHANAVIHDERDNSLIVSGQAQGLVKISWDNKLKWILAPNKGWNPKYADYLLSPNINSEFEWSWGQHAPNILPNGNILLFDNGFGREFGKADIDYSRAVEYSISENNNGVGGTVSQIWQYGKERGADMFSPFISDVDYLKNTSTKFITAGSTGFDLNYVDSLNVSIIPKSNFDIVTRLIEVNEAKEVLFELTFSSNGGNAPGSTYRAEKLIFD